MIDIISKNIPISISGTFTVFPIFLHLSDSWAQNYHKPVSEILRDTLFAIITIASEITELKILAAVESPYSGLI